MSGTIPEPGETAINEIEFLFPWVFYSSGEKQSTRHKKQSGPMTKVIKRSLGKASREGPLTNRALKNMRGPGERASL